MNRTQLVLVLVLGIAVVGVVLVGVLNASPQSNISLIEVEVYTEEDLCDFEIPNALTVDVRFKLLNSGEDDVFAVVEMRGGNLVVRSERFFVPADEAQIHTLFAENLPCSITQEQIDVRVVRISPP